MVQNHPLHFDTGNEDRLVEGAVRQQVRRNNPQANGGVKLVKNVDFELILGKLSLYYVKFMN